MFYSDNPYIRDYSLIEQEGQRARQRQLIWMCYENDEFRIVEYEGEYNLGAVLDYNAEFDNILD